MKYLVIVHPVTTHAVVVEASCPEEAQNIAEDAINTLGTDFSNQVLEEIAQDIYEDGVSANPDWTEEVTIDDDEDSWAYLNEDGELIVS